MKILTSTWLFKYFENDDGEECILEFNKGVVDITDDDDGDVDNDDDNEDNFDEGDDDANKVVFIDVKNGNGADENNGEKGDKDENDWFTLIGVVVSWGLRFDRLMVSKEFNLDIMGNNQTRLVKTKTKKYYQKTTTLKKYYQKNGMIFGNEW